MKKYLLLIMTFVFHGHIYISLNAANDTIRFASYNVRVATDPEPYRQWSYRKADVADIIKNVGNFDVFGVQELRNQTQQEELMAFLSDTYAIERRARDNDAGTIGERIAILYKKDRFFWLNSGFFFLNESTTTAGPGWDAKLSRVCMWIKFKDLNTNKEFYFFNTHFDHAGVVARRESALLILRKIKEINTEKLPLILVGDLNAQPDKIPILNLLNGAEYQQPKTADALLDSRTLPPSGSVVGTVGTTNGWNNPLGGLTNRIDYIFLSQSNIEVPYYITINDRYNPNAYPSDHFPVMIKALLPEGTSAVDNIFDGKLQIKDKEISITGNQGKRVQIFNLMGVMIRNIDSISASETIKIQEHGYYILKLSGANSINSAKILIK